MRHLVEPHTHLHEVSTFIYIYILNIDQCVAVCICMDRIKNNYNTIKIINFFRIVSNYTWYQLTLFLNYAFLKYVIFSHYIYIYICILEFNWFQTFRFLHTIIHLLQKLKTQINTWWKIRLQLKSNLESNWIWTLQFSLNNSLSTKLKIKQDTWCKIEYPIKI